MTVLVDTLQTLGLDGEPIMGGRWVRLRGERGWVYVAEAARGRGFYTWCDDREARYVELYADPAQAIQAGLRRSRRA